MTNEIFLLFIQFSDSYAYLKKALPKKEICGKQTQWLSISEGKMDA